MRSRHSPLAVMAVMVLALTACATRQTSTAITLPTTVPVTAPPTTVATPPTTERLPVPVPIPAESYAREPIVEIGSIEIPAIGLEHRLYQGVTLYNIDQGPSHWPGTAQPGELGNAVFAGHRVTNSHPFRRIDELKDGDEVIFRVGGTRSVYRVASELVVTPQDTWIADQTREFTATLYACHPPGSVAYRYVVRLKMDSTGPEV